MSCENGGVRKDNTNCTSENCCAMNIELIPEEYSQKTPLKLHFK